MLGADDRIYAIPCDADHVLRITPATGAVEEIGASSLELTRRSSAPRGGYP